MFLNRVLLLESRSNDSLLADLSVRLIYFHDGTPATVKDDFEINLSWRYYIGTNGEVIPGVTPVLANSIDL